MDDGEIRRVQCTAHFDAELQSIAINRSGHPLEKHTQISGKFFNSAPRFVADSTGRRQRLSGVCVTSLGGTDVADVLQVAIFVREWANMSLEYKPMPGASGRIRMMIGLGGRPTAWGRKLNFGVALAVIGVST
jgi:hypothetical protein